MLYMLCINLLGILFAGHFISWASLFAQNNYPLDLVLHRYLVVISSFLWHRYLLCISLFTHSIHLCLSILPLPSILAVHFIFITATYLWLGHLCLVYSSCCAHYFTHSMYICLALCLCHHILPCTRLLVHHFHIFCSLSHFRSIIGPPILFKLWLFFTHLRSGKFPEILHFSHNERLQHRNKPIENRALTFARAPFSHQGIVRSLPLARKILGNFHIFTHRKVVGSK